ncbi:TonB-dependent receptor [Alteromonas sp. 1_MG-2023]|uniref:TonB-dependent receptor n=1 Tax=Alteromonas sp. 1_MG-2023 TaxID=3062669 RepID=UPI0026E1FF5F|nr:TonB-dependent receptor [Alteromonas sp. 1_MG-2023]MDO6569177.1 TonB-dependent receptor [Alteromonas sp. 1_MG-2023]
MNIRKYSLISLSVVLALGSSVSLAQESDEGLERIQVTGSNIKRNDLEGAAPVQVIGREDIDRTGFTNLQQLLETLPAAGTGTFSTQGNNQDSTANGGAAISLRGFGADATLVLINGRRVASSAFAEGIVNSFVDINNIPVAAIERIEILKDGASAVYGSDAVAGVVNVILRKNFEGTEVSLGFGGTTGPSYEETSFSLLWGTGNEESNATVILDYFKNTPLMRDEVGIYGTVYQPENGIDGRSSSGFPGTFIVDGVLTPDAACPDENIVNSTCRYDYGPAGAVLPVAERIGVMLQANQMLSDYAEGYIEMSAQHNTSMAFGAATPLGRTAGLTVSAEHPDNPYGTDVIINNYRTVDAGGRVWNIESDTLRLVAGIRGTIKNWDYDVSAQKGRSKSLQTGGIGDGWIRVDYLQREIDAGNYNPFGGTYNDPDVVADISTSLVRQGESHMTSFNANIAGDVFTISDMTVQMAAGAEYREEDASDKPDEQFERGLIFGTEAISAQASRDITAAYIEFLVPFTDTFDVTLAGRYDDYSDFGSTTNPQVSFSWRPLDNFSLRASWGQGFRAPSLAQIGLGPSQDSPLVDDFYRCESDGVCEGERERSVIYTSDAVLQPEESTTWNIGVVWQVTEAFDFTADLWSIEQDNKIDQNPVENIYAAECGDQNSTICQRFDPLPGETLGQIDKIYNVYVNLSSQEASGLDVTAGYLFKLDELGMLKFGVDWSYIDSFEKDGIEYAGELNYPEHRGRITADWTLDDYGVTAIIQYIGEFESYQALSVMEESEADMVDSHTLVSLQGHYNMNDNTKFTLGATNLFDTDPPFTARGYGYVAETHSLRGRFIYGSIKYKF